MLTHPYRSPSARVLQSPRGLTHDPATAQIRSSRKPRGQRRPCCSRVLSPSSARGGYQSTSGGQAVHRHASTADIARTLGLPGPDVLAIVQRISEVPRLIFSQWAHRPRLDRRVHCPANSGLNSITHTTARAVTLGYKRPTTCSMYTSRRSQA